MPTQKYQLTWMGPTRRWRKKFRGKAHYFPIGKEETMKNSYLRCLAEWLALKKVLEQQKVESPRQRSYRSAIHKWRQVRDWHARGLDDDLSQQGYEDAEQMIATLQKRLNQRDLPALERHEADPLWGVSEGGRWVWADRFKQQQGNGQPVNGTIAGTIVDLLKVKRAQVDAQERSASRYDAFRCHLEQFRDWTGGDRPIADLNYNLLESYHTYLLTLVKKDISKPTARDRMQAAKQLAIYCGRKSLIPPILFDTQDFTFRITATKVKTASMGDIKTLLDASSERTKLYMILMLNTGMTQKDISDLEQKQVDWNTGRIKRKRSKTQHQKGVPEVDYPLWQATFAMLKKHRSRDRTRALLNERGGSLFEQTIKPNGQLKKTDNIKSAFSRVARKLRLEHVTLKQLRATSATILNKHRDHQRLAQQYLGHAPTTIAERHYIVQSQEHFDKAVKWLGTQYGIK